MDASKGGGAFGLAEEGENIWAFVVDEEEAFSAVDRGLINNASAIIALQGLRLKGGVVF